MISRGLGAWFHEPSLRKFDSSEEEPETKEESSDLVWGRTTLWERDLGLGAALDLALRERTERD